jgi:hypothetical protein
MTNTHRIKFTERSLRDLDEIFSNLFTVIHRK